MVAMRRRSPAREMDEGGYDDEGRGPRMGGTDVFRGVLVLVVALAVGAFVFSRGLDGSGSTSDTADEVATDAADSDPDPAVSGAVDETGAADGSGDPATDDAGAGTGATADQTTASTDTTLATTTTQPTTTALLLRPPAEVKVLVLNSTQTRGIAARATEVLTALGHPAAAPKNATSQRPSAVLYNPGFEGEAIAVAEAFGPDLTSLVAPYDPADPPIDDTQEANVIVIIGSDGLIPVS